MGYSDSDFAGDISDRKSTSGQIFFLGGLPMLIVTMIVALLLC